MMLSFLSSVTDSIHGHTHLDKKPEPSTLEVNVLNTNCIFSFSLKLIIQQEEVGDADDFIISNC